MTEREKRLFNLGIITGELGAIAQFNTKTDHGYEFEIEKCPKNENIKDSIAKRTQHISDSYELKRIETKNAFNIFFKLFHDKWFYAYQNKDEYHLSDVGDHFSLYVNPWKKEWIEEFVDFLLQTLNPMNIYEIEYDYLKTYYASDYDEFLFECEDGIYHLRLSVSD
ncbi:hypothetical protein [Dokdonia sp.]|uniref:hypothetical protein n=1 Tax=Dokdonia sp. TaxID=2024995 RepID=UPI0032673537